jgi:anthranilate/para-aminobenzoate synthase component I
VLGAFPVSSGLGGGGEPPADPDTQVVLLDSAGGSPRLARRSLAAWRPEAHLWAKDGRIVVSRRVDGADSPVSWHREEWRGDPFAALRALVASSSRSVEWVDLEASARAGAGVGDAGAAEDGAGARGGGGSAGRPVDWVGAYGLVGYDAARAIESLPDGNLDDQRIPDLDILFPTRMVCFDHTGEEVFAVADSAAGLDEIESLLSRAARAPRRALRVEVEGHSHDASLATSSNMTRPGFDDMITRGREYVWAGDVFQTNLAQRRELAYPGSSSLLYDVLRIVNPSPFAGYLRLSGYELFSSSPERLVRLQGRTADTRPIAGTRRRGRDFDEDGALTTDLNLDPKERAEHIMLVDLERNDLGRVCEYGSVRVDELMVNERYSHVIHIVSNVTGTLGEERDAVDLLRSMFPGGTITGCPKVRCMEIIDELENRRRGAYTGSFGFLGYNGDMDMNIVIRTLVRVGDLVWAQAGGGIVADSVPEREYHESLSKAEAMVRAVGLALRLSVPASAGGAPPAGGVSPSDGAERADGAA